MLHGARCWPSVALGVDAMFLLDIDNFKGVNDLYGAGLGDGVLKIIANRLLTGTAPGPCRNA